MQRVLDLGQNDFGNFSSHWPLACDFQRLLMNESQNMLKCVLILIK